MTQKPNIDKEELIMYAPDLGGVVAVVTGASRGFGQATAAALANAGATVVGVARSGDLLTNMHEQLGDRFVPVVADATEPDLPARLLVKYRPRILVLNAGAAPHPASIQDQTWETFSRNWNTDVAHVFGFVRQAILAPLDPGSTVVTLSSGAAMRGSPLSGGYAGAKATIKFITAYAAVESQRNNLGLRFTALLPQITPATQLGAAGVEAYAAYNGITVETFLEQLGTPLTADQVAKHTIELATNGNDLEAAYLLTSDGLRPVP